MDISRFLQAARSGCVDPIGVASRYCKNAPSAPAAPDYAGAAQATAAGNVEAARVATKANRVTQNTPYGSLEYSQDPNDQDKWTANYNLSPIGQQLLNYQNQASAGMGEELNAATNRVRHTLGPAPDFSSVKDIQDKSYQAVTSRLDPQWEQRDQMDQTRLRNQGLLPGSEAYENARREFNQGRNDAYQQANLAAIQTAPQTYQLATALRNQPLNELNALRTGSQVTNPTFQQAPQQQTTAGPNMLGAAQAQYGAANDAYNSQVGQQNAMMSGLFGVGGQIAGALPWASMFSDRRLKSNIERIGTHPLGFGIYEYDIFGDRQIGYMADEVEQVMPEAVMVTDTPEKYKAVHYWMLN